jgi:hypothetical protein
MQYGTWEYSHLNVGDLVKLGSHDGLGDTPYRVIRTYFVPGAVENPWEISSDMEVISPDFPGRVWHVRSLGAEVLERTGTFLNSDSGLA